jgi:hypothetical protein
MCTDQTLPVAAAGPESTRRSNPGRRGVEQERADGGESVEVVHVAGLGGDERGVHRRVDGAVDEQPARVLAFRGGVRVQFPKVVVEIS